MRFRHLLQTFAFTAVVCSAQQNTTGTNDLSSLQHQRLAGTADSTGATTGNVTGRLGSPNNALDNSAVAPTLLDYGAGTDEGNVGHFVTMSDKQFATMLAERTLLEIELGRLAVERGSSSAVKQIGSRMIDDCTRWSTGMRKAAVAISLKLPEELNAKQKATLDRISALSGAEFDQAYLKETITQQTKALTMAEHEASSAAGVSGFRHWAGVMVPVIQQQLKDAKQAMSSNVVAKK